MADRWYDASYANSSATLRLHVYTVGSNAESNYTIERADLWMRVNANWGYYNNYGTSVYVGINGNDTTRTVNFDARVEAGTQLLLIGTWDTTVWHNSNGDASIGVSCSHVTGVSLGNASGSWTYDCDHLNRYANFTQHYVQSKSMNTVSIYWNADASCDYVQYSINGGGWTNISGHPTYTVRNLQPNTNYSIKTRIRRADSGLWTESGTLSFSTLDMARLTNFNSNLKLGEDYNYSYTNPSNAKVEIGIYEMDGNTPIVEYKEYTKVNGLLNLTEEEIKLIYKKINMSNTYNARIYIRSTQNGSSSWNWQDIIIKLTGKAKTVTLMINGILKKGIVWVGTSAGNKAGVFTVGTSNGNRRGS